MATKIYVGNLPYSMTQAELSGLFAPFGEISSTTILTDKHTGRSRGFGFVEMAGQDEARRAIAELDGKEIQGRKLKVSEAMARKDKGSPSRNRSSRLKR